MKEEEKYIVDLIVDKAGAKGTGSWSSIESLKLGYPASMIMAAVTARNISSSGERNEYPKSEPSEAAEVDLLKLEKAYDLSRMINHIQGFVIEYARGDPSEGLCWLA